MVFHLLMKPVALATPLVVSLMETKFQHRETVTRESRRDPQLFLTMDNRSSSNPPMRARRSPRKRRSTARRDRDIYQYLDSASESEGDMCTDSDPEFDQTEGDRDDSECDDAEESIDSDDPSDLDPEFVWQDVREDLLTKIRFSGREIVLPHESFPSDLEDLQPAQVFGLFFDEEVIELIVCETNRNARRYVDSERINPRGRANRWKDTDADEIRKFFALVMYMGLVKYPEIADYWRSSGLYRSQIVPSVMSRNRFQLLLRFLHFSDNLVGDSADRSRKFIAILNMLQEKFCCAHEPGEKLTIDETMIPFKGRLRFKQYMPGKSHRYGIKMFKLCSTDGYVFRMKVYTGRVPAVAASIPSDVVLALSDPYLDEGRTLTTDNYFTSVTLARDLLKRRTHLLGTLRKNRKHLPPTVSSKRLSRGQIVGKISGEGIVVAKWKDKRDVFFLTTKHDLRMAHRRKATTAFETSVEKIKPAAILDYNSSKHGVDKSDQMASHHSPVRKTIRWYHKVVFELLLNTAVVNARIIFNKLTGKKISIKNFREALVEDLTGISRSTGVSLQSGSTHEFVRNESTDKRNRKIRGKCQGCYARLSASAGRTVAMSKTIKVNSRCEKCDEWLCVPCFTERHKTL